MGFGLSALLGLAGGAQAAGQGLTGLSERFNARDVERQRTALQLMLAGYQPAPTPSATGHPNAQGMLAHTATVPADVVQQLGGSVPELRNLLTSGFDPSGISDEMGGASVPEIAAPQPMLAAPTPMAAPTQAPSVLSSLLAPRQMDVPGMGTYEESPQMVAARRAAAIKQQADVAHTIAETKSAEALTAQRQRPEMSVIPTDRGMVRVPTQGDAGVVQVPGVEGALNKPDATPHFTTYQDTDPGTGSPRTMRLNTTTGESEPVGGGKQSGGTGARGFGAGGIFGGASALGSIKEMHKALPNLQKFEVGLLSEEPGSPTLRVFDTYRQNILNAGNHASGGHGAIASAISNATRAGAADELARINPQLALYARNMAQWIVADLNLTRSASDERGRMDQIASSVLAVPLSDMPIGERIRYVHEVGEGRRARLEGLDQVVPAAESMLQNIAKQGGQKAAPHPSATPPPSVQKKSADDYLRQHGITP